MTLIINDQVKERFEAAKQHARKTGLTKQFAGQLNFLRTYANNSRSRNIPMVRVTLGHDFAPHSFSIVWERRDKDGQWGYWFNGGLIFHGEHDNGGGGGAPTFSVNLVPHNGWKIHT